MKGFSRPGEALGGVQMIANAVQDPGLPKDERASQRDLMARKRKDARRVFAHQCRNPARRKRCEKNVFTFLKTYFPEKFYNPFTADHRMIVSEILGRAKAGGDKAIAAPRGEGKTTLAECVVIYMLLLGLIKFAVIVAATGPHAARILENIKHELEFNDLLFDDFPEVCCYIRDLEGAPQRAAKQTDHEYNTTHIEWSRDLAVLPSVAGSKSSGRVLMAFGLDAAIRGVNYHGLRPDFVLLDDPETRESAASDHQVGTREEIIERDLAGLAGQGKRLGRLMLCTIQNRKCLAYRYTDRKQKPSWGGERIKLLRKLPNDQAKWDEFQRLIEDGGQSGDDPDGRNALAYYKANRKAMDAGAEVSNPHNFIAEKLEISGLQHCYCIIARIGWNNFATEYQNDPPEEAGPQDSGLTALVVRSRLSGTDRGVLPPGVLALTAFIDIGKKELHWVSKAWGPGGWSVIPKYGDPRVMPGDGSKIGIEKAIYNALHAWRAKMLAEPLVTAEGNPRPFDLVLIDSGSWPDPIYQFVLEVGKPYMAAKGFGSGHVGSMFSAPNASVPGKKIVGNHWVQARQKAAGLWLFEHDADHWKRFAHERWLTPTFNDDGAFRAGGASLYGLCATADERQYAEYEHRLFSNHIVAEMEKEEFVKGKGIKRFWDVQGPNHYLDCDAGNCAAADMLGVKLFETHAQPELRVPPTNWFASQQRRR